MIPKGKAKTAICLVGITVFSELCSMEINEIQDEIIETFELFDDWEEKYEYIIDLGKKLPPMDDALKTDDNIIKGCQSVVWLSASFRDGKVYFEADSQAIIVKGLVSMLLKVLTGHSPKAILNADLYFIEKTGLTSHLAQTRSNGLASMVKQMKTYALAFHAMES
jgi:cysteine desulfuration protein SufE